VEQGVDLAAGDVGLVARRAVGEHRDDLAQVLDARLQLAEQVDALLSPLRAAGPAA
jgi:hypothetical protein